ncbi:MAG: hypothetical protein JSW61_11305 [Candidatus Thorarchaeota archaeon]|nr:MAG: hypothetical protein JSW61_11305 [Candidatus Thorarchaeota archaeon]
MKKTRLLLLLMVSVMVIGALPVQPIAQDSGTELTRASESVDARLTAGFDSENITVVLLTPANVSEVSGTFNMTLNVTSINGLLNLTVFIDGEIYQDYNRTNFGPILANTTVTQNITIDTTGLAEGSLNFTLLLEDNSTGVPDFETYTLVFVINNHGPPSVVFLAPQVDDTMTGPSDIYLNITSDYPEVYLNVTVDGEITEEFNGTLVPAIADNHTINCSRYDNGQHLIGVVVWTEEGLQDDATRQVFFLDHVRFAITGLSSYARIEGNQTFNVRIFTPYDNVTFSAYVDGELASDVVNITLNQGLASFALDTSRYTEGEHNFTFRAYDAFGHFWVSELILTIDNFGVPTIHFTSPGGDIVVGYTTFTVHIETEWEQVNVTVYVDGEEVPLLTGVLVDITSGDYEFSFDTNLYSKWEHEITVEVVTEEGESAETSETFGFANIKVEEIASIAILLGLAIFIPIYRKRGGYPLRPFLVVDAIFVVVILGLFFALGVSSLTLAIWHFNLASIWAIGAILVFTNWVIPLLDLGVEEE